MVGPLEERELSKVGEVLAPENETEQDHTRAGQAVPAAEGRGGTATQGPEAAKAKSQVPVWREGLAWSVLSVDYQRILQVAADRARLGQGPVTCQEMAVELGMDVVPARVEALRCRRTRVCAEVGTDERAEQVFVE